MTIIKKFDTSQVTKPKFAFPNFSKKFIFFAAAGIFALIVLEVWANNTVVTYGDKLESITALQQSLQMENQILENNIAKMSSLTSIASESALLGFSKAEKLEYIR